MQVPQLSASCWSAWMQAQLSTPLGHGSPGAKHEGAMRGSPGLPVLPFKYLMQIMLAGSQAAKPKQSVSPVRSDLGAENMSGCATPPSADSFIMVTDAEP